MKRGGPLKRTGRLKPMSDRTRSRIDERSAVRAAVHERDRGCVAVDLVPSVRCAGPLDVDEIKPRSGGGDPYDPDHCQVLCRAHHDWKGANPQAAHDLGLRRWSWEP